MANNGKHTNILVGVDDSTNAHIAFIEAVHIAKRNDATLYIAYEINNVMGYLTDSALSSLKEEAEELCLSYKKQAKDIGHHNIQIVSDVGSPKHLIAKEYLDAYQIDLLVLGATGKHRIETSVIGSLPQYATIHSDCDVLIVKP